MNGVYFQNKVYTNQIELTSRRNSHILNLTGFLSIFSKACDFQKKKKRKENQYMIVTNERISE